MSKFGLSWVNTYPLNQLLFLAVIFINITIIANFGVVSSWKAIRKFRCF